MKARDLVAWYQREIGHREHPFGSNSGERVRFYQSATGAYRAPWCVSFLQKGLQVNGVPRIADRSAGVFYCVSWARRKGLLRYKPKPGYFACYMWGAGHIGVVETVHDGGFTAVEGNATNAVRRKWRDGRNTVYIQVPGVNYNTVPVKPPKPKPKWVPRFQIVSGEGKKTKVIAGWDKWSVINARIPRLVAQGRAFRLRRKLVPNK